MQSDAHECISTLFFEYQRLRKIRDIINSAHTLTRDAMRNHFTRDGRDGDDVDARLDIGLRLGLLGVGSAVATIFGGLALSADSTTTLICAGLSSTALMGLHGLKTMSNMQVPYLAVGVTWIAGLAYLTSMHPVGASLALVGSVLLLGRAKIFQNSSLAPVVATELVPAKTIQDPEIEPADDDRVLLDSASCLISTAKIGDLELAAGEHIIERIHIADRVQFLRNLSQIRAGETSALTLKVRLNTAERTQAARFEDFELELAMREGMLELRQAPIYAPLTENFGPDVEPGSDKRFLTIVSHELRTPLNAIIGFSDVLRSDLCSELPEATRREYIDLIHGAGSHLLSLVNTILDVSKIESGTYTIDRDEFDFPQTARECIAMLGAQAKQKNILINDRIMSSSNTVNGDRRAIKQVLINLLSNAIKYTEPNGFVTVDAQMDDAGLMFEVSDTGIGMSAEDLDLIAKPFAQVDNTITRSNEGTGLGLALVKGLVELHGGELSISSKQGVGTNVKVQIPKFSEKDQSSKLTELRSLDDEGTPPSKTMSELQTFARKELGHGTRKAG